MLCSFWRPHPSTLWIVGKMKCRPPNREASPSFVMSFLSQKENKSNCSMGAWLGRRYQLRTIAILRKLLRGGFGSLKRSEKNHKDPIGTSTKCITMYQDVFDWHHEFGRTMSNLANDTVFKAEVLIRLVIIFCRFDHVDGSRFSSAIYLPGARSLQGREHQHQSDSKQKCRECTSSTWNWICCVVFRRRWLANPGSGGLSREMSAHLHSSKYT